MENYFATMLEDIRHERHDIFLALTDPDKLKQSKVTEDEICIIENVALEKLHPQKSSNEYFALQLIE